MPGAESMVKRGMALKSTLSLLLLVLVGCAKSNTGPELRPKSAPPVAVATPKCDTVAVKGVLRDAAEETAEKSTLEAEAKTSPEKANFRRLYDSELRSLRKMEDRLALLQGCGAPESAVADLKNKVAKSRANVTYLGESFPDFK